MYRDLEGEIAKKEAELQALREEGSRLASLTDDQRLAEVLHGGMCTENHTDGCGWYYSQWGEGGDTRTRYLEKARRVLQVLSIEEALKVFQVLFA